MKSNRLLTRIASAFFCATFSAVQIAFPTVAKDSLAGLKNKQSRITKQQAALNKKLNRIKNQINVKENYSKAIKANIKNIRTKIEKETRKLEESIAAIQEKQAEIDTLQTSIDERYEQLKKRVVAIYKAGDTSLIEIFMESKDFTDLLDKADIVQQISRYDSNIIDALNSDIQKVALEKTTIENNKVEIETIKISLDSNQKRLESAEKENEKNIQELQGNKKTTESRLNEIIEEKQKLEDEISKFHEEYIRNQANNGSGVKYTKGRYVWPAAKCHAITSKYGPRWGRFHHGIDIAGGKAHGTPILAAADGVVIKVNSTNKWGSGWGYHVMIDHGDGYATQYAHCSSIDVRVGQHVKAGQVIAKIGNTGHSFGAHLHFETWHNGKRYNPETELKK